MQYGGRGLQDTLSELFTIIIYTEDHYINNNYDFIIRC